MREFELMLVVRPNLTEEELKQVIERAEEYAYQALHSSIKTNSNFSLYDIAISYKKFLLAKQYFANY